MIVDVERHIKAEESLHRNYNVDCWRTANLVILKQLQTKNRELNKRECTTCGEVHPISSMCPSVEVRTHGDCWYHKKIKQLQADFNKMKKCLPIRYKEGYIKGLSAYAWWKDGVQYVGTCGQTLKKAIEEALKEGK